MNASHFCFFGDSMVSAPGAIISVEETEVEKKDLKKLARDNVRRQCDAGPGVELLPI